MRTFLIVLSSLLTISAMIPYLIEVAKGKDKPKLVTWFIWSLLAGIGGAAAFASHQIPAGVFITTTSLESAAVVVLGLKNGDRSFEKLDIFCLIGALIGLGAWIFLKSPELTVVLVILIDTIGAIPTIKHSWLHPYEETWITYALFVVGEIIILSITDFHVFTGYAYPIFYLLEDGALTLIILISPYRKSVAAQPVPANVVIKSNAPQPPDDDAPVIVQPAPEAEINTPKASLLTTKLPAAPAGLTASSPTQVPTLTWAPIPDASSYNIYRDGVRIESSSAATFSDTSVTNDNHMYFVTAVNAGGESSASNTIPIVVDQIPPSIHISLSRKANEHDWHNSPVTVSFIAEDTKVGIASCSPPVILASDGINQTVSGSAMNFAGDSARVSTVISIDQTPPLLSAASWSQNPVPQAATTVLSVLAVDHLSGIVQAEYVGSTDPGQGHGFPLAVYKNKLTLTLTASVPKGTYPIHIRAKDAADNWSALLSTYLTVI